jgi:hypothetical protein
MRLLGILAFALLLAAAPGIGPAVADPRGVPEGVASMSDRIGQASDLASEAAAANAACGKTGAAPGTAAHAECVRRLLRTTGQRLHDLSKALAHRASWDRFTCIDQVQLQLVRCFDI